MKNNIRQKLYTQWSHSAFTEFRYAMYIWQYKLCGISPGCWGRIKHTTGPIFHTQQDLVVYNFCQPLHLEYIGSPLSIWNKVGGPS